MAIDFLNYHGVRADIFLFGEFAFNIRKVDSEPIEFGFPAHEPGVLHSTNRLTIALFGVKVKVNSNAQNNRDMGQLISTERSLSIAQMDSQCPTGYQPRISVGSPPSSWGKPIG